MYIKNVLSLFDGMSCGQIALSRAGIKYKRYIASEIDKYAIQIAKKNYPNTYHYGDVTKVKVKRPGHIGLLMGGSPCQGFSFAGKQLNFDDPRSKLFFEFVRILKEAKPRYFLLENVKMKQQSQDVISEHLGVEPIEINSALVSAQNRKRLYWTNIPGVKQPEDKEILLKDILELNIDNFKALSDKEIKSIINKNYSNPKIFPDKTGTLNTKNNSPNWSNDSGTTLIPIGVLKDHGEYKIKNNKSNCIDANYFKGVDNHAQRTQLLLNNQVRKLTPIECERLQTVPDDYTAGVSNTQRYKMLGNGWTVDVIAHILKHIHIDKL